MILIVDSNIIFAGILRDSVVRELLIDSPFRLYAPEALTFEIYKYKSEIIRRSELSEQDFETLFRLLTEKIVLFPKEKYAHKLKEAYALIGHIDAGDVPFLALALSIPNDGIWTENVKHFGKQNKIKIFTNLDVIKLKDDKFKLE